MTFNITVYGADHDEIDDREKGRLAQTVHDALRENHDVNPDSVGVEGASCELCSQPQTGRYRVLEGEYKGAMVCAVHADALESGRWDGTEYEVSD